MPTIPAIGVPGAPNPAPKQGVEGGILVVHVPSYTKRLKRREGSRVPFNDEKVSV